MRSTGTKLKDFYQSELSALRDEALTFAGKHPEAARSLGLNAQQASDPQAELLIQSFAYLTGRLQYRRELDQAELPNALLSFLYPHLEAPVPCMLVAEITVKPDGANFAKEQLLARGRNLAASAVNDLGRKVECRFRTCYDTPLMPLRVDEIHMAPAADYVLPPQYRRTHSILRVRIVTEGAGKLQTQGPQRLRFYINSAEPNVYTAYQLYELLSLHLTGIAVHVPERGEHKSSIAFAPLDAMRWLGFEDNEAMLEARPHTHPGYRLLQEYFAFREKFLFFDAEQLDFSGVQDSFELLFLLDTPMNKTLVLTPQVLRLNCVPLINLFSQRIDPMALDHTEYEYRLQADLENHRYCEIHSLQELESIRPDGSLRPIVPYFAMEDAQNMEKQDYFYVTRRECSEAPGVEGSEIFVSFLDRRFDLTHLVDEIIGGKALCTNRRLPERFPAGETLRLEGAGPITRITSLGKPTPHLTPDLIGTRPWALVSQLSLNHVSLTGGPQALTALKEILRLHIGANQIRGLREIDALKSVASRSVVRHVGNESWRGFVRGIHVRVDMDRNHFEDGSPVLFCEVLRRFFALYATVNNLVEVSLVTQDLTGNQKQWQALAGAQTVL
jgi:type VI secretion system protein ImpG